VSVTLKLPGEGVGGEGAGVREELPDEENVMLVPAGMGEGESTPTALLRELSGPTESSGAKLELGSP
jgi:hypothetical protein